MQSLLQVKHRQTSIIKCFRYYLYITDSHFGERFTNTCIAKMGAVIDRWQIRRGKKSPKIGGQQISQSVPKPKESVPHSPIQLCDDIAL